MANRDLDLAEERRLRFRIGVNLGDVIADGGDIYGDGVNITVRLEADKEALLEGLDRPAVAVAASPVIGVHEDCRTRIATRCRPTLADSNSKLPAPAPLTIGQAMP
jgi:class 3 adenylate cyclase